MSLREYARKRRFDKTPEPDAEAGRGSGHRPVFVIQLHHASVRHYDFRLEVDGVLKSWSVPKGPSLRPGERRLAVEVEDHPLAYADFTGDIPEGHYGAGHVDLFDRGVWSSDGDPLEAIAAGKLDFVLHGERLGGGWKLVRTGGRANERRSGKPQWLLIKRSDDFAADTEADEINDAPTPEGWKGRRPSGEPKPRSRGKVAPAGAAARGKAAAGTATARKVPARAGSGEVDWKARAQAVSGSRALRSEEWIEPQLASLVDAPPAGDDWLNELKWDGYRMLARLQGGSARLRSRNGLDWTAEHPDIVRALEGLGAAQAQLDGELIALDSKGRNSFSELQRTLEGSSSATLRYVVFDLLSLAGVDLTGARQDARKALLATLLEGAEADGALALSRHIEGHGAEVFAASQGQEMEGIISKAAGAPYVPGRTRAWLKVKHAQTDEFVVVGYTAPKRSRVGFGSLLVATREAGRLRYAGRVGTGFDDAMLRRLTPALEAIARSRETVALPAHVPFAKREVTWVEPRMVVELAFRGLGKEGLLRQASFQRLREDKEAADVGEQATSKLTSPDKLIYPGKKITKQQVADYYRAVAGRLLPEVVRRPLSMLRCPEGAAGTCFFQKHHADTLGGAVHAVPIREKDGGHEDYVYIEDANGLLDLVQMNVLELHPWGSTIDDVEHPDRLVFDLDPGEGVDWSAIKAAARDVRDRLAEIGLEGFLRLSGGKGLHVVVPIAPGPEWSRAKAFCEAFADAMATRSPDRYVATASKAKRKGVIFIDWLRNGRGATSVASWSLRAREAAGVAMPLRWDELGRAKSGSDYDLERALRRASSLRNDPWSGWEKACRQVLPDFGPEPPAARKRAARK